MTEELTKEEIYNIYQYDNKNEMSTINEAEQILSIELPNILDGNDKLPSHSEITKDHPKYSSKYTQEEYDKYHGAIWKLYDKEMIDNGYDQEVLL